ncbi:MAG: respiratory nitrate reductase subunit gamma [Deltaproteobacteria bacterium]|nr:respiratory nitrate reductase subunit gamma [Deltaproteobacteria bacterium]
MDGFAFVVGGVLPYVALPAFLAMFVYRIASWYRTPQPAKMTLFQGQGSTGNGLLSEALFFPSLFRGDRLLWALAWFFHVALALAFLGHFRVFTGLIDRTLLSLGMSAGGIGTMSAMAGGGAGIVLAATAVLLFFRRLVSPRVREISGGPDFLALGLLIAVIVSGNLMRFGGGHFDLAETHIWAASLLSFSPVVPMDPSFLVHVLLAQALIVYIPFSKIMHSGGIFFTHSLVKGR